MQFVKHLPGHSSLQYPSLYHYFQARTKRSKQKSLMLSDGEKKTDEKHKEIELRAPRHCNMIDVMAALSNARALSMWHCSVMWHRFALTPRQVRGVGRSQAAYNAHGCRQYTKRCSSILRPPIHASAPSTSAEHPCPASARPSQAVPGLMRSAKRSRADQ